MKKKIIIIISIIISLIIIIVLFNTLTGKPVVDNSYRLIEKDETGNYQLGWLCMSFSNNGSYSMYDCESEPSGYPFDSEYECRYNYLFNNMYFTCFYKADRSHFHKIKVLKWDEETFEFKYDNKTLTLKSRDWIEKNIEEEY